MSRPDLIRGDMPPHPLPFPRLNGEPWPDYVRRVQLAAEQARLHRRAAVMASPEAVKLMRRIYDNDHTGLPAWNGYIPPAYHPAHDGWQRSRSWRRDLTLKALEVAGA